MDMSPSFRPPPSTLLQFLKETRRIHHRFLSGTSPPATSTPVYVLGNPSADLDSIISAILYSYFAHRRVCNLSFRPHIPILNLPAVAAGPELCRLRPEFVKALWHATHAVPGAEHEKWAETLDVAGEILREHLITTNDFARDMSSTTVNQQIPADAVLVDWNALPIRSHSEVGKGGIPGLENVSFSILGYIDHHVDEGFVPARESLNPDQPAIITPAGSCTSLVTNHLMSTKLWPGPTEQTEVDMSCQTQLATLALFAIYIDTARLTAKEKVTEADIVAERFLSARSAAATDTGYEAVLAAKANSLDLLTIEEILDRDLKVWTESLPDSSISPGGGKKKEKVNLGFCSIVKPIPWLVRKTGTPDSFLDILRVFAMEKDLDVVVIMTAFTTASGEFCRELFVSSVRDDQVLNGILETFVSRSVTELGLEEWRVLDDEEGADGQGIKTRFNDCDGLWNRLWVQGDVSKSRKQVAPLLRGAVGHG